MGKAPEPEVLVRSLTYEMVHVIGHIVVVTGTTAVTISGEAFEHSLDSVSQLVTVTRLYEYTVDLETAGMTSTTTILVATVEESEVAFNRGVIDGLPSAIPMAYDAQNVSEPLRPRTNQTFSRYLAVSSRTRCLFQYISAS